jgi:putative ubiquitin-RnfH superfamily antitoxin RatB of RatAB toxin-antitoxin module
MRLANGQKTSMDKTSANTFDVQVVCATAVKQHSITLTVTSHCTALQAAQLSGIKVLFPDLDWSACQLGIFGRVVSQDQILAAGDRVEIYRPLLIDPKESRRQRAHDAKRQRDKKLS